jgi:putative nucleotidyltransferase with HDIG domain
MFKKVLAFFKPPEYDTIEQTHKANFLHVALMVSTASCILLAFLNIKNNITLSGFLFVVGGISFLAIPANRGGFYQPVAIFFTSILLAAVTYSLLVGVGLKDAGIVAYPIYIIITSYLFSKKAVLYTTLLSIGSIALVYFLETRNIVVLTAKYSDKSQLEVLFVLFPAVGFLLWAVVDNWEKIASNLRDAYDLTLSGWGQALEYRDHETQGHSQRVVEVTVALAKQLGISGRKLDNIRRGALLHDIGKMAVPDSILLKRGSLNDAEWETVKKHPIYALNMLKEIPYLKEAIDIPYSHHEKWDGSGYPQGLKQDEIPFAARIFAVVDVWDALTSERPYRHAWPEEMVWELIEEQTGKQFDPRVVKAFVEMAGSKKIKPSRQ